uniref:Uncharacterized protein n=1 Tax=Romanomermis culicivorax TaxID=13658 RepID=A0A915KC28_ROMCU
MSLLTPSILIFLCSTITITFGFPIAYNDDGMATGPLNFLTAENRLLPKIRSVQLIGFPAAAEDFLVNNNGRSMVMLLPSEPKKRALDRKPEISPLRFGRLRDVRFIRLGNKVAASLSVH